MFKEYKISLALRSVKFLYTAVNLFLFYLCWENFYANQCGDYIGIGSDIVIYVLYTVLIVLLNRVYNVFDIGTLRETEMTYSAILAESIAGMVVYVLVVLSLGRFVNIIPMCGLFVLQGIWSYLWAYLSNKTYFYIHKPKRTVVIYRNEHDLEKLKEISKYGKKFDVQKYIADPQNIHQLIKELEGFEVIFVAGVSATLRNGIAKYCVKYGIEGYIEPKVGDILMAGAQNMQMFSIPIMKIQKAAPNFEYLCLKRALDVVVSLVAIIILSPVMIMTAIAIKAYDGGPVLYKQVRLTKDGKTFKILKFRSMRVDAEKDGIARLSVGDQDDRITPVGKVIRKCRLDELPQLFNILEGSMTVVGPRPERPEIAAQYEEKIPDFRLRLQVKAGLTGYAQIYGRYNTLPYDKLQMDLMYINKMSLMQDIRLMLATIKVLFMKESTEGVTAETNQEIGEYQNKKVG